MTRKPLRAGDLVQLKAPAYGEPDGDCRVLFDQADVDSLVWFISDASPTPYRGPCFVARPAALRLIKRTPQRKREAETVK